MREYSLTATISLIAAASGGVIAFFILPSELTIYTAQQEIVTVFPTSVRVFLTIAFTLMWGFFGFTVTEYVKYILRRKDEKISFLTEMDEKINNRTHCIIEHSAFYTEGRELEKVIESLHRTNERRLWIIAKFISKKLDGDFSSLKIDLNGKSYSQFAEGLYPECEHSIFLTSPFTPKEWFHQLPLSTEVLKKIETGEDISIEKIVAPHVRAFANSPAEKKRRLVILSGDRWNEIYDKSVLPWLKKFVEVNKRIEKGIQTRFVSENDIKEKIMLDLDVTNYDYAIFDRELMLEWKRPSKREEMTSLYLHIGLPQRHKQLLGIFDFDTYKALYKTGDEIIDEVVQKSQSG